MVQLHQECLDLARKTGDPEGVAMSLAGLALHSGLTGNSEQAVHWAEESVISARTAGDPWLIGFCLHVLALTFRRRGDGERAVNLLQESLAMLRPVGDRWNMAMALVNLGGVAQARGDTAAAWSAYQEALVLAHELRDRRGMAMFLECLAEVAVAQERLGHGAQLMGAAEGLLDTIGAAWPPPYVASRERTQTAICAALGEANFTAAREEGRSMPLEEAIAYALKGGSNE
jgi:non-specific serine/threonine protein kinase